MVEPSEEISDAFKVLSDGRRRYALYHLIQRDPPVSFGSLATQVAASENDTPPDQVDETTLEKVRAELHHTHLPKLARHGIIDYEDNRGEITDVSDIDHLRPYLSSARRSEFGGDIALGQT